MRSWGEKPYHSLDYELKHRFGEKVYKLTLNGGMSCPNRDGKISFGGCIFCSEGGSGEFASAACLSIPDQIQDAKKRLAGKRPVNQYIAYFQAYTNTYAPAERLRELFEPVMKDERFAGIAIATRPDCLSEEVLDLLAEFNEKTFMWVELGLQTSNEETAEYIRRCYRNEVYEQAVQNLNALDIPVITHVILGLPGETKEDMATTVRYAVDCGTWGIKLQLLHVLEGTDLGEQYKAQEAGTPLPGARPIRIMTLDEYTDLLCALLPLIPRDVVIHRITGDGPKRLLLAPLWSGDKKRVLNTINKAIRELKV